MAILQLDFVFLGHPSGARGMGQRPMRKVLANMIHPNRFLMSDVSVNNFLKSPLLANLVAMYPDLISSSAYLNTPHFDHFLK